MKKNWPASKGMISLVLTMSVYTEAVSSRISTTSAVVLMAIFSSFYALLKDCVKVFKDCFLPFLCFPITFKGNIDDKTLASLRSRLMHQRPFPHLLYQIFSKNLYSPDCKSTCTTGICLSRVRSL